MSSNWQCLCCQEQVPQNFEVCWKCGANQLGEPNPEFKSRPVMEQELNQDRYVLPIEEQPEIIDIVDYLQSKFRCLRCQYRECHASRVETAGVGFAHFYNGRYHYYAALSCNRCGHTEFFNLKILGENHTDLSWLDKSFDD